jgi:TPR repeat protein
VTKNEAAAAAWFERAAQADNPVAQLRLAKLYADGRGVSIDPEKAARWYLIAKGHGFEDDGMEDFLKHLDPAALKTAQVAAAAWNQMQGGVFQTAMAPPPSAPVDNRTE